jgi:cell division protein ZapE
VNFTAQFQAALAQHGFTADQTQLYAASRLGDLQERLAAHAARRSPIFWGRLWSHHQRPIVKGVYLWGGVGRGKTMLLDLFAATTQVRVRRSHFHHFMHEVHARLRDLRHSAQENPLTFIAEEISKDIDLLCFDELYVSDIADAMILGTLFEALTQRGVTLVITSNAPPENLYKDGLQRNRFLPTIALLERLTEVVEVDAGIDYRLRRLQREPLYIAEDESSDARLESRFRDLAMTDGIIGGTLDVEGRSLPVRRRHAGIVWFEFDALCRGPRGTDDYIALAHQFHTIVLSGVDDLTADENAARRFIALVDELYDRGVKLLMSTTVPLDRLYQGDRLAFEFRRTLSRLTEMQSSDYLQLPHRS